MAIDLILLGNKIRKYRIQFELTLDDLAEKTGITNARLEAIESGLAAPSGDEILILADCFKCDYKFFVSNERLAPYEQTETLFRHLGNRITRDDKWAIQEFLFLCECEAQLTEGQQKPARPFSFQKKGDHFITHGAEAANALRSHLLLDFNSAVTDIYDICRTVGCHVFRRKLSNSEISGLYVKHPVAGNCILINYSEDVFRQRFTAAHELGHTILDAEKDFVVSGAWGKSDLSEKRANTFASHFLMPPDLLRRIQGPWTADRALEWSAKLSVSTQALGVALKGAGLIDERVFQSITSVRLPASAKTDPELPNSLSPSVRARRLELLSRGISPFYVNLCFDRYDAGDFSSGRLAEMLLVDQDGLIEFSRLFGRRLKYAD